MTNRKSRAALHRELRLRCSRSRSVIRAVREHRALLTASLERVRDAAERAGELPGWRRDEAGLNAHNARPLVRVDLYPWQQDHTLYPGRDVWVTGPVGAVYLLGVIVRGDYSLWHTEFRLDQYSHWQRLPSFEERGAAASRVLEELVASGSWVMPAVRVSPQE